MKAKKIKNIRMIQKSCNKTAIINYKKDNNKIIFLIHFKYIEL